MQFDWDMEKATANLQKHGISFLAAILVFNDPDLLEMDSTRLEYGETRMKAIGKVQGQIITVIYTDRGDVRRIISARKVRKNEREQYYQS